MEIVRTLFLSAALLALGGCAAGSVAISKRQLDVQNKMSDTVFLTPTANKTVYVDIRNTSDKPNFNFGPQVATAIQNRGYRIVTNPDDAHFMLQANVLQVGQVSQTAAQAAFGSGFGTPLGGALTGMAAAAVMNNNITGRGLGAVGLAAGAADYIAGNMVKDVYYSAIIDVQISERTKSTVHVSGTQDLAQGASGGERVTYDEESNYKRYRTRVVSTANKVNLKWEEAEPVIVGGVTQSISGVF
ncbi:complement resistance protein TraT [Rhodanobacter thiooxydans]|uniref:complement resistance protein TraT n=1 Tax=Rhodanobacter thiooxydans TaxID=416169 RepID=UPI000260CD89|nr:complement resistance protein TraT [Rhodanobacter thiooxydans]EIL96860.1 TraT complement resistance family protein [Rhodanobacter thiooxydans LCS2]MCW0201483.1 complement resistance protein TraT [Rhodanobacter thiooxydans]